MKIEITQELDIEIPEVPKHLKATGAKKASIPIGDLPAPALQAVATQWGLQLLAAAGYGDLTGNAEHPDKPTS